MVSFTKKVTNLNKRQTCIIVPKALSQLFPPGSIVQVTKISDPLPDANESDDKDDEFLC